MKNLNLLLVACAALVIVGCGGGGGFTSPPPPPPPVNKTSNLVNWFFLTNQYPQFPPQSWAASAATTAATQGVPPFIAPFGVPVSQFGMNLRWYSRLDTYGWNGIGQPPFIGLSGPLPDNNFTVATAMTGTYTNLDGSNAKVGQGFFSNGWTASFNPKAISMITTGQPFVLALGNPNVLGGEWFVMVIGLDWQLDGTTGAIIGITAIRVTDPQGLLLPPNQVATLTQANTTAAGITLLGTAWMDRVAAEEGMATSDTQGVLRALQSGGRELTSVQPKDVNDSALKAFQGLTRSNTKANPSSKDAATQMVSGDTSSPWSKAKVDQPKQTWVGIKPPKTK